MGTRGITGFVIDGELKVSYQQYDSYPGGVGSDVLEWLRTVVDDGALEQTRTAARKLRVMTNETPLTDEIRNELREWTDPHVSTGDDWYATLRHTQGQPGAILRAGYLLDAAQFAQDSLFCEWGYVVDLDGERLEVYEGFQCHSHADGRFAALGSGRDEYAPIRLIKSYPFDALPTAHEFIADTDPEDGE